MKHVYVRLAACKMIGQFEEKRFACARLPVRVTF
jgi:hypothetical protein